MQISEGSEKIFNVLIDTGAEVNLIRRGVVQTSFWNATKTPQRFVTANSTAIWGGDRELLVDLTLNGANIDSGVQYFLHFPTFFFGADIAPEAILSFGWLADFGCCVDARRHGIVAKKGATFFWIPGLFRAGVPPSLRPNLSNLSTIFASQPSPRRRALDLFVAQNLFRRPWKNGALK